MANENVIIGNNPYTLARGKLLIRKDGESGWQDFAHISELTVNVTTEKLEHFSSRSGLKKRDKSITTQMVAGGSCTVDLPILDNIRLFFQSETKSELSQAAAALAAVTFTIAGFGKWIHLGKYKFDPVDTFTVTNTAADTTYTEDVDYVVDRVNGLLAPIEGGLITASQDVKVTCDYLADERVRIDAGEVTQQQYHVWFIGDPAAGVNQDIKGFANLAPSGDLALIGDDWQSFQLTVDFQEHADYAELLEYIDKGVAA